MRKAVVIIIAVIMLLGAAGCESLRAEYIRLTDIEPSPAKENSLAGSAARQTAIANASNIATAINAYNALYPNSILPDGVTLEEAKETLGDSLWPRDLSDEEAEEAWKYIVYKDGIADIILE